jgi:ADP-ribose pyrophosphatase YjhB (NUDIX family)
MITCTFEDGEDAKLRHITVCVIVCNKEQDKILLVRRANLPDYLEANKLVPPGGYMSRDETTLEAAYRETLEETGYKISDLSLLRINDNPDRPKEDRENVDFIFIGVAQEKISEHDHEISEVNWYENDNLPSKEEFGFDHYENIQLYLKYREEQFALPLIGKIYTIDRLSDNEVSRFFASLRMTF